jgi:3-hydroxyisobutyrate dehydrogenase
MNTPTIGWIGLGKMGTPMTQQLLKAGYTLIVYNRTKEKEAAFKAAGIGTAPDPAALVSQTEVVFLMVTDDQAVRELFTSDNGLLSARPGGKIFINMSTVSPDVSKEMAALCRQIGNEYVDAPVSGSVKQATDGQLVIMVGAEESWIESEGLVSEWVLLDRVMWPSWLSILCWLFVPKDCLKRFSLPNTMALPWMILPNC